MAAPAHILVFRFSALGDVAMSVPVIRLLLQQYPALEITFVSNPFMKPLFENIPRLHFYGADTKKEFHGLRGLHRLSRQIKTAIPYDAIADLHDVVRTKALRFFLIGKPAAVIDKGRKEKKELTRPVNKILRPLKTTFQRYADVFEKLGFPVSLDTTTSATSIVTKPTVYATDIIIGIAPFAKHQPKMYPLEKLKEVVAMLTGRPGIKIILFGSKDEALLLAPWETEFAGVTSLAGKVSFSEELQVISTLHCMVSMDSANMHLASMFSVPVVSIWGGTHPYLGFYGWGQPMENAVQTDLPCRPSSVFGNRECPVHGAKGCMQEITPLMIYDKIIEVISKGA